MANDPCPCKWAPTGVSAALQWPGSFVDRTEPSLASGPKAAPLSSVQLGTGPSAQALVMLQMPSNGKGAAPCMCPHCCEKPGAWGEVELRRLDRPQFCVSSGDAMDVLLKPQADPSSAIYFLRLYSTPEEIGREGVEGKEMNSRREGKRGREGKREGKEGEGGEEELIHSTW